MARFDLGGTKRRCKGLVDFVIGEALGLAGVLMLFGRDGKRGEGLGGLPWAKVHGGLRRAAARAEEGEVRHRILGRPRQEEAEGERADDHRDEKETSAREEARLLPQANGGLEWGTRRGGGGESTHGVWG